MRTITNSAWWGGSHNTLYSHISPHQAPARDKKVLPIIWQKYLEVLENVGRLSRARVLKVSKRSRPNEKSPRKPSKSARFMMPVTLTQVFSLRKTDQYLYVFFLREFYYQRRRCRTILTPFSRYALASKLVLCIH